MDPLSMLTPFFTALSVTAFALAWRTHMLRRIMSVIRSWRVWDRFRRSPEPPTLADLMNQRKQLRFEEFASWDAEFRRLDPPPLNPVWQPKTLKGHFASCIGEVEWETEDVFDNAGQHVREYIHGYCRECGWSGPLDRHELKILQLKGKFKETQTYKRNAMGDIRAWAPEQYQNWKREMRGLGYRPTPANVMRFQQLGHERKLYQGPVDGNLGENTMRMIRSLHFGGAVHPGRFGLEPERKEDA